jgi:hypothetical protein
VFGLAENSASVLNPGNEIIALIAPPFVVIAAVAQSLVALSESPTPATGKAAVDQLIPWLMDEDQQLRGVPKLEQALRTRSGNYAMGSCRSFAVYRQTEG